MLYWLTLLLCISNIIIQTIAYSLKAKRGMYLRVPSLCIKEMVRLHWQHLLKVIFRDLFASTQT